MNHIIASLGIDPIGLLTSVGTIGSKMHHRTFTLFNVIGATLWATLLLGFGYVLGSRFPGIGDYLDIAIVAIIAISIVPVLVELRRQQRSRPVPNEVGEGSDR